MNALTQPIPNPMAVQEFDQTVGAIVIGGDYQGLGIVRSLAEKGYRSVSSMTNFPSRATRVTARSL